MDFTVLKNIGKLLNEQLNAIGIEDLENLQKLGSENTWVKIKEQGFTS